MTKTYGADYIEKPYPEGILSGEGDKILTRGFTVKDNTAIDENELVMTPRDTGDANYGELIPYTGPATAIVDNYTVGTTVTQATHRIIGIATEATLDTETGRLIAAWTKGGFKFNEIKDADTLLADKEVLALLHDKDIHVTEELRGNGE